MFSKRKRTSKSSKKETKSEKRVRLNSPENDDDKEFLALNEYAGSIFEQEHKLLKEKMLPFKRGKIEMSTRVCGLTVMQRNRMAHYLIPAFNAAVLPTKNFKDLQKYPSCNISAPSAIYVAKASCAALDICHQRPRVYDHYKNLLTGGRTRYLNQLKKNKKLESLETEHIYSSHVFNFAERFNADPDPYFYGSYDYYYTGGNLCKIPDTNYLLHANGENLTNLVISNYEPAYLSQQAEFVNEQQFSAQSSEIFEVRDFPTSSTNHYHFTVRQRTEFTLSSLNTEDCETQVLYSFKAKVPFISSTHVPNYKSHLLTSNMCQQLRLYDLDEAEVRIVKQYNINSLNYPQNHSWNMLRSYNEHTIIYANEQEIFLMDPRTSADEWLRTSVRETHAAYACEKISCIAVSQWKPYIYVANTHHLHALDLRKFESDLNEKSTFYSSTHQMHYPAAFMDTLQQGDIEYIAMSSAVAGEVRLCELGSKEMEFCATSLAYQPPTLKEAYHHAKLSGRCLQAAADLSKRVALCTTGLTFGEVTNNDNLFEEENDQKSNLMSQLLISNSIGDIFAYSLLEKQDEDSISARVNEDSDKAMQSYAETICSHISPVLQYSDVCQMAGIKKTFRCHNLTEGCVLSDELERNSNPRRLGRWQRSFAALKQFKDALAQDLLSIWDIEEEKDRSLNVTLPDESKNDIPTNIKVSNWLSKGTIVTPPMTSICVQNNKEEPNDLINGVVMEDNILVDFKFVNTDEELQLFTDTQGTLLPLGQIINIDQVETLTQKEREEQGKDIVSDNKKISLSQIFDRGNSCEDITSIPASIDPIVQTVKVVHMEVPASTESVTDSYRHAKIANRPPTPAKLGIIPAEDDNDNDEIETNEPMDKNTSLKKTEENDENTATHIQEKEILISSFRTPNSPKKQHRNSMSDQSVTETKKLEEKERNQQRDSVSDTQSNTFSISKQKIEKQRAKDLDNQSTICTLKKYNKKESVISKQRISISDKESSTEITSKKTFTEKHKKDSFSDKSLNKSGLNLLQKRIRKDSLSSNLSKSLEKSTTSTLTKQHKKQQESVILKQRISVSDKESFTEKNLQKSQLITKKDKQLLNQTYMNSNKQVCLSDKSSIKSEIRLLQKRKRKESVTSISSKSPKKVENKPSDGLKQMKLFDSFTTLNTSQFSTTLNKTEMNSTLNSTMNSTGLNKTKKVLKTKPKFKKYVKGF